MIWSRHDGAPAGKAQDGYFAASALEKSSPVVVEILPEPETGAAGAGSPLCKSVAPAELETELAEIELSGVLMADVTGHPPNMGKTARNAALQRAMACNRRMDPAPWTSLDPFFSDPV